MTRRQITLIIAAVILPGGLLIPLYYALRRLTSAK